MPDVTEKKTDAQSAAALGQSFFDRFLDLVVPEPGHLVSSNMSLRYLGKLQSLPTGAAQRDIRT